MQFDSFAHRLSAHWTNLTGHSNLAAVSAVVRPSGTVSPQQVLTPGRTVRVAEGPEPEGYFQCNKVGEPCRVGPSLSRPDLQSVLNLVDDSVNCDENALTILECEQAMGYAPGSSAALDVPDSVRRRILGVAPDAHCTAGMLAIARVLSSVSLRDIATVSTCVSVVPVARPVGLAFSLTRSGELPWSWPTALAAAGQAEEGESGGGNRYPDVWTDDLVMYYLRNGTHAPDASPEEQRRVTRRARAYRLQGEELFRVFSDSKARLVPKPPDRIDLVKRTHEETGHFGVRRTMALLLTRHWWYGMHRDVSSVVRHCPDCDRVNSSFASSPEALHPLPVGGLFYRWGVDLCGPFTRTAAGNTYVMICIEHFSKYAIFVPIAAKEADHTSFAFLHHILGRYGSCAEVCTDNGGEWKGPFAHLLLDSLIDHRQTSSDHPQANGLAERAVQTCKRALRRMAHQRAEGRDWDRQLPYVMLGYNCSTQEATGFSPYHLLHGVQPTIPPAIKPRFEGSVAFDSVDVAVQSILSRSDAMRQNMALAGENLLIAQHRDTLRYAALRGGGFHPKIRRFDILAIMYTTVTLRRAQRWCPRSSPLSYESWKRDLAACWSWKDAVARLCVPTSRIARLAICPSQTK